jgi:hypothetical protein
MSYDLFQNAVIALVVAYSAVQLLRKLMPQTTSKLQKFFAALLQLRQLPGFVQRWGRALQPAALPASACDSGCSICNMCATGTVTDQAVPIRFI